jgi:phage terminase large subunit
LASVKRVVIPYAPRRVLLPYHNRVQRFAAIVAHRRMGKTVGTINDIIKLAFQSQLSYHRAAYVAPYLKQAKDISWDYLKRYAQPLLLKPPNESELWVEISSASGTPARIRIYGADNAEALRGGYLDNVALDEPADMHPGVWPTIIRPMLADRKGRATFIGTPKGRDAFFDIVDRARLDPENWFHAIHKASETGLLDEEELRAARLDMTPEQYEQEFECSFDAAIMGAYFGKDIAQAERDGRIREVAYNPDLLVHTAWDLGIGDSTAIWCFQVAGSEIRVIDHLESSGVGLDYYAKELASKPYKFGNDYVPHDARVRELGTGRTRVETLQQLGRKPVLVPSHKIMDGINAARLMLPRCYFDAMKCKDGLEALRQYRSEFDEKTRAFKDNPRHDWTSHAADAFRYMAMAYREMAPAPAEKPKPLFKPMNELTFDELHDLTPSTIRERV